MLMRSNCRILYLSSSWPAGRTFGGQLRALHIGRALRQYGSVTLQVVNGDKEDEEARRESADEFTTLPSITPVHAPNRSPIRKLRSIFDSSYLNIHGCLVTPGDRARVLSQLDQFDLIWLFHSRTPDILDIDRWPRAHLDIDDLHSTYLGSISRHSHGPGEKLKARLGQLLMKRRELMLLSRFVTLSVDSEDDRRYLCGGDQVHVIPNGYSRPLQKPCPVPATDPPRIGFIGLFSYAPNLDGVSWFLKECWPLIRGAVPGIRFRLVGRDSDGPLRPTGPGIDALGYMADTTSEIASWSAMVIPIRLGAGTRIKIADAFSRMCPVVSTSLGAFGYGVTDKRHLRIADDPGRFAEACVELVRDRRTATSMAERAWTEFLQKWTWEAIAPRVWAAAEDCLRRSKISS